MRSKGGGVEVRSGPLKPLPFFFYSLFILFFIIISFHFILGCKDFYSTHIGCITKIFAFHALEDAEGVTAKTTSSPRNVPQLCLKGFGFGYGSHMHNFKFSSFFF